MKLKAALKLGAASNSQDVALELNWKRMMIPIKVIDRVDLR